MLLNLTLKKRENILGWALSLPAFMWVLLIIIFPVYLIFWTSLHHQRTVEINPPYVGLTNFFEVIQSLEFWNQVQRTLIWTTFNLILIVPFGVLIALVLNLDFRATKIMRTWILLPWMFPIVVTTLMFRWILEPTVGVLSFLLRETGITRGYVAFLSDKSLAMPTVIMVNVWRWAPFMTLVTLAALQTVPQELYSAGKVDGANSWQQFWFITFPQILPSLFTTSFICNMWLLNMFPPIWLMTEGGPSDATKTLPIVIYRQAFRLFNMGKAATYSVVLLIIEIMVASIYLGFFSKQMES